LPLSPLPSPAVISPVELEMVTALGTVLVMVPVVRLHTRASL
jgi:hypothetical protein